MRICLDIASYSVSFVYCGKVRLSLEHMPAGSSIINTSSINAYKVRRHANFRFCVNHPDAACSRPVIRFVQPMPQLLDYATTKGAIVAFTKGLATQLISTKGIRTNCVAPGPVWTVRSCFGLRHS